MDTVSHGSVSSLSALLPFFLSPVNRHFQGIPAFSCFDLSILVIFPYLAEKQMSYMFCYRDILLRTIPGVCDLHRPESS